MIPYKYRLFYAILLIAILIRPITVFSQQRTTGPQLLILDPGSIRLDSLSDRIARQSGIVLTFNALKINPEKRITLLTTPVKLGALLSYLHQRYQLASKAIGNHIILTPDNSDIKKTGNAVVKEQHVPVIEQKPISDKGHVGGDDTGKSKSTVVFSLPVIDYGVHILSDPLVPSIERPKTSVAEDLISDLMPLESLLSSDKGLGKPSSLTRNDTAGKGVGHGLNPGKSRQVFFTSLGLTTDDVLYASSQVRAGLPWLFATGALGSNFRSQGFFYGIGSSVRLSDHWGMQLSVLRGMVSKEFGLATDTFTAKQTLRVKSHLTRINLAIERQISSRWTLQFGPVINFMKSNYSVNELAAGSSDPTLPAGEVIGKYDVLKPLYTLSESYNDATGSGKAAWIGVQIGLFYRLY